MRNPRTLIVDDDPFFRRRLGKPLEQAGHRVWYAANAREGLELVPFARPDIIFADQVMPGPSGFDFCERIAARGALADSRPMTIVMTGSPDTEDPYCGIRDGVDLYLSKADVMEMLAKGSFQPDRLTVDIRRRLAHEPERDMSPDRALYPEGYLLRSSMAG